MSKEAAQKKTKVWFNDFDHYTAMNNAHAIAVVFKEAKEELERIIEGPITDFAAFKKDVLGYSIAQIRLRYSAAFTLGLSLEKTLAMLSIDLKKLERADGVLSTTPYKICVCDKTGEAKADDCKEEFTFYAETEEQHSRLIFANELANILERANLLMPYVGKSDATLGLTKLVYFDPQSGSIIPNHFFVMNGLE